MNPFDDKPQTCTIPFLNHGRTCNGWPRKDCPGYQNFKKQQANDSPFEPPEKLPTWEECREDPAAFSRLILADTSPLPFSVLTDRPPATAEWLARAREQWLAGVSGWDKLAGRMQKLTDAGAVVYGFSSSKRTCRVCGCTDDNKYECQGIAAGPCLWAEVDLCSTCVGHEDIERTPEPTQHELLVIVDEASGLDWSVLDAASSQSETTFCMQIPNWAKQLLDLVPLAGDGAAIHINDRPPNTRTATGSLHIKHCFSCDHDTSGISSCIKCGWTELEALDLTPAEFQLFKALNRLKQETELVPCPTNSQS